jgi:hypothetical protein
MWVVPTVTELLQFEYFLATESKEVICIYCCNYITPLKAENNICMKIQFLLREKALDLHYSDQAVTALRGNIIIVYCENYMEHTDTLCVWAECRVVISA